MRWVLFSLAFVLHDEADGGLRYQDVDDEVIGRQRGICATGWCLPTALGNSIASDSRSGGLLTDDVAV